MVRALYQCGKEQEEDGVWEGGGGRGTIRYNQMRRFSLVLVPLPGVTVD